MKPISIRLGVTMTYLLPILDHGYIMIDAGEPGMGKRLIKALGRHRIDPRNIRLIIITHAHYDHVGSLAEILNWCQCPVLIHPLENEILQKGQILIPPGTTTFGKAMSRVGSLLKPFMGYTPGRGDILVESPFNLDSFGIDGQVLPTPGHTDGSLSVVLKSGEAFVGDLAMNFLGADNFPIFGNSIVKLNQSRELIRSVGTHTIYPAHGRRFSASDLTFHQE